MVFHFCHDLKSLFTVAAISRVQTEVAFKILSDSRAYMHAYTQAQGQTSPLVCPVYCAARSSFLLVLLIPFLLVLESWSGFIFHRNLCVPEMEKEQTPKQVYPEDTETIQTEEQNAKREFNTGSRGTDATHVKASTLRVLATPTISKCHWGFSFTVHKKTMGRINKRHQYFNHMKVINPWENKYWILLVILMLCYCLV